MSASQNPLRGRSVEVKIGRVCFCGGCVCVCVCVIACDSEAWAFSLRQCSQQQTNELMVQPACPKKVVRTVAASVIEALKLEITLR